MLNKQYIMSIEDISKFKELKITSLYKEYINNVVNSPILLNIANEHVKNIDITDDVEDILSKHNFTSKQLNKLFKDTIKHTAINMIADALIIKDIIDVSFEDSKEELNDNFKVQYLLGLADESFYLKAEKIIKKNPNTDNLIYKGYMEYIKYKEKNLIKRSDISILTNNINSKIADNKKESKNKKTKTVDINVNDIDF